MRRGRIFAIPWTLALVAITAPSAWAQRQPPLVGTVAPGAVGAPAPTPVPLGGLRTRPLSAPSPTMPVTRSRRAGYPRAFVIDAPRAHHGVVLTDRTDNLAPPQVTWYPTAEPPRWVMDSSSTPVQAWRDLIVTDNVCSMSGVCIERQQRLRARWVARCACYAFADGWNRIWRVD